MRDYKQIYKDWLDSPDISKEDKEELVLIEGNDKEIEDRFYKDLEFGTGGLRGQRGTGTNRINIYTVRKATQGLANYILKKGGQAKGVAIAYDSRCMSREFAEAAANCLNANGIVTYIFTSLRPTPELSFAVQQLGAIAGIVITASHNPPEYNGYKVYWDDGAQITYPIDEEIIAEVGNVKSLSEVKTIKKSEAEIKGLFKVIGSDMDDRYMSALLKLSLDSSVVKKVADKFKIVYSPFNGTGNIPVRRVLYELGFKNVYVVHEQEMPDPDFTTLKYPNPEDPEAFALALDLAKKKGADIVMATDPDADRLGVYVKDETSGEYAAFTGNMSAMIIAEYILSRRREKGILHERDAQITEDTGLSGVIVTTIVSTKMARAVADYYNLKLIEVLTGFKYIGEQIKLFGQRKNHYYEFGFEESYGCLVGIHSRDKDAPAAVMVLAEAAAYYYSKGLTLIDVMNELYDRYGYYEETQHSVTMKGADGAREIAALMDRLRTAPPSELAGIKLSEIKDYKTNTKKNVKTGEVTVTGLPSSNVFYMELEDDSWICIRPSGTEPKIKIYIGVRGESKQEADEKLEKLKKSMVEYAGL